jgi:hypothetical protein
MDGCQLEVTARIIYKIVVIIAMANVGEIGYVNEKVRCL